VDYHNYPCFVEESHQLRICSRRRFLRDLALVSAGALLFPPVDAFTRIATQKRPLSFHHLHTGERLIILYSPGKPYALSILNKVNYFLRDHRTDEVHPIDPALLDILYAVSRLTGSHGAFKVISGYRSAETNAMLYRRGSGVARYSLHRQGRAIDIRLSDINTNFLQRAAVALRCGGVGYYPEADFVHLDTGRIRAWQR
jgi:uncharacterized protein YcbK (DUF882 family)